MKFIDDHGDGFIALPLPVLPGSVDFQSYQLMLSKIDQILSQTGIEKTLGDLSVEKAKADNAECKKAINEAHHRRYAGYALRCNIARVLTQESYRSFSVPLADSILLRKFCGYDSPHAPKNTPSKSTLQRFEGWYDEEIIRRVTDLATYAAADVKSILHNDSNGLVEAIDTEVWLLDSTCAELDIHYPVDWVLLKDCIKSIIQAIIQIRKGGIRQRIGSPESFLTTINKLSMQMTNTGKKPGSKKERKKIFRKMKKLLDRVKKHGERYLGKLEDCWCDSDFTEAQKNQIVSKMNHTIDLIPAIVHQAHERIIGERKVDNKDKVLSLHEDHAKVYSRGKSGAQVEFGLQLVLGESLDGIITHWELINDTPKNDTQHIDEVLKRIDILPDDVKPELLVGDRGFYSEKTEKMLSKNSIKSNICPRDPAILECKLGDHKFAEMTKRRAQTEARIGILKNNFLGKKLSTKGYENQSRQVAWAVLSHNLWVLARLPFKDLLEKNIA
ncbi:MAG: transposase [Planctomycetes bacterium]|nr:transposase [Planctomycetota bacterium]